MILFIIGLFVGLLLMITGAIMGVICGTIKEIPRAVLLSFAVIFVYILALSVDMSEASTIFVTSIPFIEQIKGFNVIVQQISNVGDWASFYQVLSKHFISIEFLDETVNLLIFSFEVSLVHSIVFPKKHHKWWCDWFIWYLKECLVIGLLILLNSIIIKMIEIALPDLVVAWVPRIFIGLLAITIILCAAKMVFKFTFPILDIFISFFTNNFVGKVMISSITTTGTLILIAFGFIIFKIQVPQGILISVGLMPVGVVFFLVWYILYALIGYRRS